MKILKCNLTHLDIIYQTESKMFPIHMQETKYDLKDDIKNGYYYGFFKNEILLGYFCIYEEEGLYLDNIVILHEYQGLGYSKTIIQYLKQYIILNNINRIWLHVSLHNDTGLGLYNKCGFKIREIVKDFYAEGEDALIMEFL